MTHHQGKGAVGSKTNPTSAFSVGEYSTMEELSKVVFSSCPLRNHSFDILHRQTNCKDSKGQQIKTEIGAIAGKYSCNADSNIAQIYHVNEVSSDATLLYSYLSDGTPIPILHTNVPWEGRDNQRLEKDPVTNKTIRLVTGCVPITNDGRIIFCSSSKKKEWILPKGGWENDEKIEESAVRETYEEAGVIGTLGSKLDDVFLETKKKKALEVEKLPQSFQSINHVSSNDQLSSSTTPSEGGILAPLQTTSHAFVKVTFFPLYVSKVLHDWPENGRSRKVIGIDEAIETTNRQEVKDVLLQVKKRNLHRIGVIADE